MFLSMLFLVGAPPVPDREAEAVAVAIAIANANHKLSKPAPKAEPAAPAVAAKSPFGDTTAVTGAHRAGISPRPDRGRGSSGVITGRAMFTSAPVVLLGGNTANCSGFR